jgi:hypothetical protein
MALIMAGSLMRATPPSRRMSAGTRSSAMTPTAPASSAMRASSGVVTSMMTPPRRFWARPHCCFTCGFCWMGFAERAVSARRARRVFFPASERGRERETAASLPQNGVREVFGAAQRASVLVGRVRTPSRAQNRSRGSVCRDPRPLTARIEGRGRGRQRGRRRRSRRSLVPLFCGVGAERNICSLFRARRARTACLLPSARGPRGSSRCISTPRSAYKRRPSLPHLDGERALLHRGVGVCLVRVCVGGGGAAQALFSALRLLLGG